jgi:hypothetical protein
MYGNYPYTSRFLRGAAPVSLLMEAAELADVQLDVKVSAALFVLKASNRIGAQMVGAAELAVMERDGSVLAFESLEESVVLLLGGEPLDEPIVAHGPFVMNTGEHIAQAMKDVGCGKLGTMEALS